jgi:hypothetical protein
MREEGILLSLVETVDLIDKKNSFLPSAPKPMLGSFQDVPQFRNSAGDRGEGDKMGFR